MRSGKQDLTPVSKSAAKVPPGEHLLNLLKAGLATTPFCGGIASLMTDYIPSTKQKRLEEFVSEVSEDLMKLKDRVDENTLHTDEFAFMFEKCFRGVAENYQAEKIQAFRGMLINSAVGFNASSEEREYFLNLANSLSPLHLRILKFMTYPDQYLAEMQISPDRIRGGFSDFFQVAIPEISLAAIEAAFGDLYQYGLISADKSMFHTMTSGQGLDLLGRGSRVRDFGKKFVQFCMVPK